VYQYEGQLQVIEPGMPCLRCLWPREPAPEVVGSCVLSGVLGPVPGVLGTMQAMEALKILLDLPRPREPALLLVNLLDQTLTRLPIDASQGCAPHGGCRAVAQQALGRAQQERDIDLVFDSLEAAVEAGFQLVDLREAEEIAAEPLGIAASRHIPSTQILAHAAELRQGRLLLVCASGRRSAHAARLLRAEGLAGVHSLAGGLLALRVEG
jgi:adenylyltransferase/sulfurtransferase